jgi:hypothetical protein
MTADCLKAKDFCILQKISICCKNVETIQRKLFLLELRKINQHLGRKWALSCIT